MCCIQSESCVSVTNLPCPSSKQTNEEKIDALKRRTRDFIGQQRSSDDDVQTSYLESADNYKYDTLAIARLIACYVTDLPGPPSVQANSKKIDTLKRRAQEIVRD
jgi:hypothetical protein